MRRITLLLVAGAVAVAVLIVWLLANSGSHGSSQTRSTVPPLAPATSAGMHLAAGGAALTLSGDADTITSQHWFDGGDYRVDWSKDSGCTLGGSIYNLANPLMPAADLGGSHADGPTSGTTSIYGLDAGWYYADIQGSCHWTFVVTRQ